MPFSGTLEPFPCAVFEIITEAQALKNLRICLRTIILDELSTLLSKLISLIDKISDEVVQLHIPITDLTRMQRHGID